MARRRTVLHSEMIYIGNNDDPAEAFSSALKGFFVELRRNLESQFDFPITIELSLERQDWDVWVKAQVSGHLLEGERDWKA